MKRKILAIILAGAMALQGSGWVTAAEEEILIVEESGDIESEEQDISTVSEKEDIENSEEDNLQKGNSDAKGASRSEEEAEAAKITIEELDVVDDPGYVQIQEAAEVRAGDVEINAENFPDEVFREYAEQFDKDGSGILEADEIDEVTEINLEESGVGDLKGIEFFKSLTSLNCKHNQLSSLDVSNNPSLKELECSWNELSSLDVSSNPELTNLSCWGNELSSLDVSSNPELTYLDCSDNKLSSLDVSGNSKLTNLDCSFNELSTLDVNSNSGLTYLDCSGNELRSLDVSGNPSLDDLWCSFNQLSSLDTSRNSLLTTLSCNENELSSLDVRSNAFLSWLNCEDNQLRSLDTGNNPDLRTLYCRNNQLSSLDLSQNQELYSLSCNDNILQVSAPVQMDGVWQKDLTDYVGADNLDKVTLVSEDASLSGGTVLFGSTRPTELVYQYDTEAPSLSESERQLQVILKFSDEAVCNHNMITVVDQEATCGEPGSQHRECSICGYREEPTEIPATGEHSFGEYVVVKEATTEEEGLRTRTCTVCGETESETIPKKEAPTGEVEISAGNFPDEVFREYVEQFDKDGNGILDAGEIDEVTEIDLEESGVGDLKGIEFFKSLTRLECASNQLSSLDVSSNTALEVLYCYANQLSSLDVSSNTSLKELGCSKNQLSSLDVRSNTSLEWLNCSNNQLSSLDVRNNTALKELRCQDNQLSSLDVKNNTSLSVLSCYDNRLSSLDVKNNVSLTMLNCENNQLSSLDLEQNQKLYYLTSKNNILQVSAPVQTNGIWQMNLAAYVGADNLGKVTLVSEGASLSGEMVLFSGAKPTELIYKYNTGAPALLVLGDGRQMEVTLKFPDDGGDACDHEMVTVVDQEATCGTPGTQHRECRICGYKEESTEIPATGAHSYGRTVVEKEATCSTPGSQHRECTVCGAKEASTQIPATGVHNYGKTVVEKEATCGTSGSQHRECTVCGAKEASTQIPATGIHSFGAYVTTKEPTTEEKGIRTRICTVCGKTESVSIPKLTSTKKQKQTIAVEKKITMTYEKNKTFSLGASAKGKLSYETSNYSVATVSSKGKVKIKGSGKAVITVRAAATAKYKQASVKVKLTVKKRSQTIAVNRTITKTYKQGEMFNLGARAAGRLTYQSSNIRVAAISSSGVVKITGIGTTVITVKAAANANYKAAKTTVKLTVGLGRILLEPVISEGKGELLVRWEGNDQVSGYVIEYSTDANFASSEKRNPKKSSTWGKITGLLSGKTYYVRIQGVWQVNGKLVKGPWTIRSGKVK